MCGALYRWVRAAFGWRRAGAFGPALARGLPGTRLGKGWVPGATGLHNVKKLHGVTTFCQMSTMAVPFVKTVERGANFFTFCRPGPWVATAAQARVPRTGLALTADRTITAV